MKARSKYVLEGAITELLSNEYDRILALDDMMVNIDSQKYLGGVTEEEGNQCADILARVKELKDEEITLLQTLARNMFAYVRPVVAKVPENSEAMEGQVTVEEVTGTAAELNTDKAMKGLDKYETAEVKGEAINKKEE